MMSKKLIKYKTDMDKSVILENLEERRFIRCPDEDWNFYWSNVTNVRNIFNPKIGYRLQDFQYINHFPNYYELTRKDLMVKNLKRYHFQDRYKRELQKENLTFDILPFTYTLPGEYSLFIEEFHKQSSTWIMKPSNKSQGKGIFLLNQISQVRKSISELNERNEQLAREQQPKESCIISKYIDRPLLIGGKKFDLRLYVLITSYRPLKVWTYQDGFCRFCTEKYAHDSDQMDNLYMHLTNVAIQKNSDKYNQAHGGKWMLETLKFYIESQFGLEAYKQMQDEINDIIMFSLKSVQKQMVQHKHCFELYGYDILLDETFKPWLIEINASPSLSTNSPADKRLKKELISDVIDIVVPQTINDENIKMGANWNQEKEKGKFTLLYDEQFYSQTKLGYKHRSKNSFWK